MKPDIEYVDVEDITIYFKSNRTYEFSIRRDLGDLIEEPPGVMHIELTPRTLIAIDPTTRKALTRETPAERIEINRNQVEQIVRRSRKVPKEVIPFKPDDLFKETQAG